MLLFDENLQEIDVNEFKNDLKNLENVPDATEEEMEMDLSNYYTKVSAIDLAQYGLQATLTPHVNNFTTFSFLSIGGRILRKIKKFICSILNPNSGVGEIIDAIVDAITSILPGGIVLKPIIKKLVKFILSKGIGAFCNFAPAL